jgi:Uma2 family endonuclease
MATSGAPSRTLTAEEFLELPVDEHVTRELIDGEIRERAMTTRTPRHSTAVARISQTLGIWLDDHEDVVGVVAAGDARCRLSQQPDTIVGIDVAVFAGEEAVRQSQSEAFFDGPPLIAIEVLSPSDTHEDVSDKIHRYLRAGSRQVWIADPEFRTVTVHKPDENPVLFNAAQSLSGEPDLPGFQVQTGLLFGTRG